MKLQLTLFGLCFWHAMNTKREIIYILGHSPAEIQRLKDQAEILRPITKRLLLSTGICLGMKVLDVGCGAGDVAMLAAELVGPSGSVIGIDRNSQGSGDSKGAGTGSRPSPYCISRGFSRNLRRQRSFRSSNRSVHLNVPVRPCGAASCCSAVGETRWLHGVP